MKFISEKKTKNEIECKGPILNLKQIKFGDQFAVNNRKRKIIDTKAWIIRIHMCKKQQQQIKIFIDSICGECQWKYGMSENKTKWQLNKKNSN